MLTDNQASSLVISLNRLTSTGKLNWTLSRPPATISEGTNEVIPFYVECRHQDRLFCLYQCRHQAYNHDLEQYYWREIIVLAILDDQKRVLLELVEPSSAIADLLSTIRSQLIKIDDLLAEIAKDLSST